MTPIGIATENINKLLGSIDETNKNQKVSINFKEAMKSSPKDLAKFIEVLKIPFQFVDDLFQALKDTDFFNKSETWMRIPPSKSGGRQYGGGVGNVLAIVGSVFVGITLMPFTLFRDAIAFSFVSDVKSSWTLDTLAFFEESINKNWNELIQSEKFKNVFKGDLEEYIESRNKSYTPDSRDNSTVLWKQGGTKVIKPKRTPYEKRSKQDLIVLAKSRGICVTKTHKKDDVINLLRTRRSVKK
jgi:hypothetical protein